MTLPTITRVTLWYATGVAAAAGIAVQPLLTIALLLVIGATLLVTQHDWLARQSVWTVGVTFLSAGLALGSLALRDRGQDCRRRLVDGQTTEVIGALQYANPRSAWLELHSIAGHACRAPIRLMLGPNPGPTRVHPGAVVTVEGEWWAQHDRGQLSVPGGVLVVKRIVPEGAVDQVARVRAKTAQRITKLFGAQAPLAAALLIAQRDDIDPKVKQDFAASGLAHLLAISGTHVALVAAGIALIASLARLPLLAGGIAAAIGSIAYVLFLGAPYPAVRAVIQIVLVLLARTLQRPAHPLGLIASAAFGILLFDPLALLDAGFQLSFGGLVGIVLWRKPLIDKQPASLPIALRDAIATSTAAAIATTPIAAFHFGQLSLIAVPANLAALPLVSLAVPAAALALALSAVSLSAAGFVAEGTRLLLEKLEQTAAFAAAVPGGHSFVTRGTVLAVFAGVAVAYMVVRQLWFLRPQLKHAVAFASALAIVIIAPAFQPRRDAIEIHAIDVGQGDAIAVRSARGRWLLIDAGPRSERFDAGAARVVPFLLRQGARKLEVLILTHPHLDHIGGAAAVSRVLDPAIVLDPDSGRSTRAAVEAMGAIAEKRSTDWRAAQPGMSLSFDDLRLDVLYPDATALDAFEDANNVSVVIRLGYGDFSALFTGDAGAAIEETLIERHGARLDVDLIKAGHHGSSTSTSPAWLEVTTPRLALISAGRGNRYGHPAKEVLRRLEEARVQVLRTDRSGTVSVRAYADGRLQVIDP